MGFSIGFLENKLPELQFDFFPFFSDGFYDELAR